MSERLFLNVLAVWPIVLAVTCLASLTAIVVGLAR